MWTSRQFERVLLNLASVYGHLQVVKTLKQKGATVDLCTKDRRLQHCVLNYKTSLYSLEAMHDFIHSEKSVYTFSWYLWQKLKNLLHSANQLELAIFKRSRKQDCLVTKCCYYWWSSLYYEGSSNNNIQQEGILAPWWHMCGVRSNSRSESPNTNACWWANHCELMMTS